MYNTHSADWEPRNAKHVDETMPSSFFYDLHPGKEVKHKTILEEADEIADPDDEMGDEV